MMGVSLLSWWAPWTTPESLCQRADSWEPSYSVLMRWLRMQAGRARKTSDVIRELGFEPHAISTTSGGLWGDWGWNLIMQVMIQSILPW